MAPGSVGGPGSLRIERDLDLGEVDGRLALVRRVVADPEQAVVPDEAGVAAVAAAGEGEDRLIRLEGHPGDDRPGASGVAPAGGPERAVGEAEEVRAAEAVRR